METEKYKPVLTMIKCSRCQAPAGCKIPVKESDAPDAKRIGHIPNTIRKLNGKYFCPICLNKEIKEMQRDI